MKRVDIDSANLDLSVYEIWNSGWFVLTSGDFQSGQYNSMTVSWGSFGCLWNLPVAMVVVRPSRFTFEFINRYDTFTLCAFPNQYRDALNLLGSQSGRNGDKIQASGLTPCAARRAAAPVYEQAELVLECRKLYWQDLTPENFLDQRIHKHYPEKDYHRMLLGEILAISGDPEKYTR